MLQKKSPASGGLDIFLALALCAAIFLLGFINLDNNCDWGDDFAAYMSDGIAMSEGRYEEQTALNLMLREAQTPEEAGRPSHVHAFGFPAFHALVHSLAGFDREGFNNLWLYKLPSLIAFAMMAGVFYLFMRHRVGRCVSLFAVVMLCTAPVFFSSIRNLHNDVMYTALSLMSIYTAEKMLEASGRTKKAFATALGLLLWLSYSVRLNGITVLITVLVYHLVSLIGEKKRLQWADILPYFDFALLYAIFNLILFPTPTSTSSVGDALFGEGFINGCIYYTGQLYDWFFGCFHSIVALPITTVFHRLLPGLNVSPAAEALTGGISIAFMLLAVLGMVTEFRKNFHLVFYIVISFVGTAALNLGQELRYLYVILPHLILLAFSAAGRIVSWLGAKLRAAGKGRKNVISAALWMICLILCLFESLPMLRAGMQNIRDNNRELLTAYSEEAVDIYRFIQEETGIDETIAFFKPRALYLNTERVSMLPGRNGFEFNEADYYLFYKPMEEWGAVTAEFELTEDLLPRFELIKENGEFALYRKIN